MKAAVALVIALAAVVAAAVFYRTGDAEGLLHAHGAREHELMGAKRALAPSAVLAIRPERTTPPPPASSAGAMAPLAREIADSRPRKPIYDRLVAKAERTGEEDWALAMALKCARTTESRKNNTATAIVPKPPSREERRERFAAALPTKAANRAQRLAAFDEAVMNPCDGFEDVQVSEKDITALLEQGAAKGDPKATVALIDQRWMQTLMASNGRRGMPTLSDADLATLKDIGGGPDSFAARSAIQGLVRNYDNFSLRVADTDEPVDMGAMHAALQLMACDDGLDCGPGNRQLRQACAMQGRCDMSNLRDFTYFYASSPASSQQIEQYAEALRRARRGDWSYFSFFAGPTPAAATWR